MILQHNEYCLIFIVKNKDHYISKQYGFTYRHYHGIISETESEEDEEDEEEVSLEDKDINLGQNIPTVQTNEELDNLIGDRPVIVYTSLLEKLARAVIYNTCKVDRCGAQIQIKMEFVSSAVYLKWVCQTFVSFVQNLVQKMNYTPREQSLGGIQ